MSSFNTAYTQYREVEAEGSLATAGATFALNVRGFRYINFTYSTSAACDFVLEAKITANSPWVEVEPFTAAGAVSDLIILPPSGYRELRIRFVSGTATLNYYFRYSN